MKVLISDISNISKLSEDVDLVNAINRFMAKGNIFVLATNKPINFVVEQLAFINIEPNYYVCNNGAVIFDRYYNVLYRKDIKANLVRPIVNMLQADNNILEVFIDTSHGYIKSVDTCANGIVAQPYDTIKAEITLNEVTLKFPMIHGQINENFINITDIDASKDKAINYLQDHYHFNKSEIYVIGKDNSDLNLLEQYNGYVLNNCSEDLIKYSKGEIKGIKDLIDILLYEEETMYG